MPSSCLLAFLLSIAVANSAPTAEPDPSQARDGTPQDDPRGVSVRGPAVTAPSTYARRHALVVGIDAYEDSAYPDLAYAVADARAVAKVLVEGYGFEPDDVRLILNADATKTALDEALEDWICDGDRIHADDLLVVFFAGHGVTRELGRRGNRGYLVPVDGRTDTTGDHVWSSLVGMNDLEDVSEAIPARHALFVLDCCFGGLAVSRSAPAVVAGLSSRARQVVTAGSAEQTVLDVGGGGHSVFTRALLDALGGDADLDGDAVVTFGELFNHVGREVERKTDGRQTPLQATFPDHEGGNVALFAPGVEPGRMTAAERLRALERTTEEQLAELKRFSDALLVLELEREAAALWPRTPDMAPRYQDWLWRARELSERRPLHEESLRRVRQEAYLGQVLAGRLEEGEGVEPVWSEVDPELHWRFVTLEGLLAGLARLERSIEDVERRLAVARTVHGLSIGAHLEEWEEAVWSIANEAPYDGLVIEPQVGLVPLGRDAGSGLWEFADVATGTPPERDGDTGALVPTEETGLVFVLVPGGTFAMGAQTTDASARNYDPDARPNEGPVHEVTLSPFFVSKYELTQGQWLRFVGENPSEFGPGQTRAGRPTTLLNPVENVSWEACTEVLGRLGLSLPTEAQWEYATRATTTTAWWPGAGAHALEGAANVADAFTRANGGPDAWVYEEWEDGHFVHAPVGSFAPNPFGLHDVHGNVWEWCRDGFSGSFYARSPVTDPVLPPETAGTRAFRGGSFGGPAALARSAVRLEAPPSFGARNLGVRPARALTE